MLPLLALALRLLDQRREFVGDIFTTFLGLAPLIVQQLFEILKAINQAERIGMLLVEQNAAMALALADQAYLLETGRVVMSGSAQAIRSDEQVRRSYLGY